MLYLYTWLTNAGFKTGALLVLTAVWGLPALLSRWLPLVVLPIVLAGCVSLTPEQSAQLKEAQQFADEVTTAYGAPRVKVIVTKNQLDGYAAYWPRSDWIAITPTALDRGNVRLNIVGVLAMATIRPLATSRPSSKEEREWRSEATRRGVEIMVKFLGMSTRQAVDRYARLFVAQGRGPSAEDSLRMLQGFPVVPPCDQLRDLGPISR
jgi:hypothetical protein